MNITARRVEGNPNELEIDAPELEGFRMLGKRITWSEEHQCWTALCVVGETLAVVACKMTPVELCESHNWKRDKA